MWFGDRGSVYRRRERVKARKNRREWRREARLRLRRSLRLGVRLPTGLERLRQPAHAREVARGKLLGRRRHATTAGYAHLADGHLVKTAERIGSLIADALAGRERTCDAPTDTVPDTRLHRPGRFLS